MKLDRVAAAKLGAFGGVTALAAAAHVAGVGGHATGFLGTALALGSAGAHALTGHLFVDLLDSGIHKGLEAGGRRESNDLNRLVGEAVARVLDREAERLLLRSDVGQSEREFGAKYLRFGSATFRSRWHLIEADYSQRLSGSGVLSNFSGDPNHLATSEVLSEQEWYSVLELVVGGGVFLVEEHASAAIHASRALRREFARELWEAATDAWKEGDLSWPTLTLRLLGEILGRVNSIGEATTGLRGELSRVREDGVILAATIESSVSDRIESRHANTIDPDALDRLRRTVHQVGVALGPVLASQSRLNRLLDDGEKVLKEARTAANALKELASSHGNLGVVASNVPRPPIHLVPRLDLLRQLRARLTGEGRSAVTGQAATTGVGGQGKTVLAQWYASAYEREYPGGCLLDRSGEHIAGCRDGFAPDSQ